MGAAILIAVVAAGSKSTTQPLPPVQTLCVLDFQRLGNDASADWLEQGLADMMISALHARSPYLVVDRKHLAALLREHGFCAERSD